MIVFIFFQVQNDHYEEFFAPELDKHGYQALYKRKTNEVVFKLCAPFLTYPIIYVDRFPSVYSRFTMEIPSQLMGVQHFSVEIDLHMSKNMRYGRYIYEFLISFFLLSFAERTWICMQVEFNKAAQSLTEAILPTAQKKNALSRLVKVDQSIFNF